MGRLESYLGSGLTILLLSCGLAAGLALVQGGLALASGRGVIVVALGAIVVGCDVTGIARFLNPRGDD